MSSAYMIGTNDETTASFNLAQRARSRANASNEIVGESEQLESVMQQVKLVAPTDSTVLILGETGTGKELIAREIHRLSNRSSRPFIRVNCAAIPPSLIASELFGHERGAFTGALQRRQGRFEAANGGTIFLDEIGELPMETQITLLRVIQEREFERIGSSQPISVDVRIVAATNRDLEAAVADRTFRSDMYYRLNVFPIYVPALRERLEDIPLLVEHLIERFAKQVGKAFRTIKMNTIEMLQSYDWPGNIRELQNVIERSVILAGGISFRLTRRGLNNGASAAADYDSTGQLNGRAGARDDRSGAHGKWGAHIRADRGCSEAWGSASDSGLEDRQPANKQTAFQVAAKRNACHAASQYGQRQYRPR